MPLQHEKLERLPTSWIGDQVRFLGFGLADGVKAIVKQKAKGLAKKAILEMEIRKSERTAAAIMTEMKHFCIPNSLASNSVPKRFHGFFFFFLAYGGLMANSMFDSILHSSPNATSNSTWNFVSNLTANSVSNLTSNSPSNLAST